MNIAVFCSGSGTNLQAIIDAKQKGNIKATIKLVLSDVENAYALERAKKASIKIYIVKLKDFASRKYFEEKIIDILKEEGIDLIVLAGFMKILSSDFVASYQNKILNIHPALLPSFKGTHGIRDAFLYGVKITGPTVHFVSKDMDEGPIILQEVVAIEEGDTLEILAEKVHKAEHRIYPKAIELFVQGKLKIDGRRVRAG
ncbi:MAG: phosphoribosylglycinamide formyltransferase [Candidatus Omnitrophota bacterium]